MSSRQRFSYLALITLIVANSLAIWHFINSSGNILTVLWIYWLQSLIIGLVNVARIFIIPLKATDTSINQLLPGSIKPDGTPGVIVRFGVAGFFVIHYGIFHSVYATALAAYGKSDVLIHGLSGLTQFGNQSSISININWVLACGIVFAIHHLVTLLVERIQLWQQPNQAPTIGEVMRRPYMRILPMHFIIIFGPIIASLFGSVLVFVAFMLLKSMADLLLFYKGASHPGTINPSQSTAI